jgi:hypothetical protein
VGCKFKIKVSIQLVPSEGLSPGFWSFGVPWLKDESLQSLPSSPHVAFSLDACLCVQTSPVEKETVTLMSSSKLDLSKDTFQIRYWELGLQHFLRGGHN